MAKKVAKKTSSPESKAAGTKPGKRIADNNDKLKTRPTRKVAKTTGCVPYGSISAPLNELRRLRDVVFPKGWKEDGCAVGDPYPGRPRRSIASLFDYSTLTNEDSNCLNEALINGLAPVKISFKSINGYIFIWDYFGIEWSETVRKVQISCTQFWPERECPPPQRSRKLNPYFGDIEISITWPDPNDPSNLDPKTEQVIVLNDVEISPYYESE